MAEVNDQKTAVRFEMVVDGEVKAGADMNPQQVDELLRNLAALRMNMRDVWLRPLEANSDDRENPGIKNARLRPRAIGCLRHEITHEVA